MLRDDGQLIVVEHGLSTDASVARWQRRLNGLQNLVACGCHLTRPIVDLVHESGFEFAGETFFVRGIPRTHGYLTAGVARKVGVRPL